MEASANRKTRPVELAVIFLIVTYIAHMLGQVLQIGGAQLAPSIVVYTFLAFLLAADAGWLGMVAVGLGAGLLTMIATSSPFPPANIAAHGGGFLFAAYLGKKAAASGKRLEFRTFAAALVLTTLVSWTLFAVSTWLGLGGTDFVTRSWTRYGIGFGEGFVGWWLYGFLGVAVPSLVVGLVVAPALLSLGRRLGQSATDRSRPAGGAARR